MDQELEFFKNEPLLNDTILKACKRQPVKRVPVWLMRQAGRYLPEYRKIRNEMDFFTICMTPKLVADITLQPLERFPVDSVVLFSDILVIPKAFGFNVKMKNPNSEPIGNIHIERPLDDPIKVAELILDVPTKTVIERLHYVYDGIIETRRQLRGRVPLIGFVGAPWTLMAYTIQGANEDTERAPKGTFVKAVEWVMKHPEESHKLLDKYADVAAEHLIEQIRHGCHLVQIFDSWDGVLPAALYRVFSLPYMKKVAEKVRTVYPDVPIICFPKLAAYGIPEIVESGVFDVISLNCMVDPAWAKDQTKGKVALQGNMNPDVLNGPKDEIINRTKQMLNTFAGTDNPRLVGYIANLGGGCMVTYDPESVKTFVDAVHKFSEEMLAAAN